MNFHVTEYIDKWIGKRHRIIMDENLYQSENQNVSNV